MENSPTPSHSTPPFAADDHSSYILSSPHRQLHFQNQQNIIGFGFDEASPVDEEFRIVHAANDDLNIYKGEGIHSVDGLGRYHFDMDMDPSMTVHLDGTGFEVPTVFEEIESRQLFEFTGLEEEVDMMESMESIIAPIPQSIESTFLLQADEETETIVESTPTANFIESFKNYMDDFFTPGVFTTNEVDLVESSNISYQNPFETIEDIPSPVKSNNMVKEKGLRAQFMKGWKVMFNKIHLMDQCTGSTTYLEAILEDDRYVLNTVPPLTTRRIEMENSVNEVGSSSFEADHRYAAVILTQKESSPTVRDHQYNESSADNTKPNITNTKLFIQKRGVRDNYLARCLKALFTKAKNLEENTGAIIKLEVIYESKLFNRGNYAGAENFLKKRRWEMNPPRNLPVEKVGSPKIHISVHRTPVLDSSNSKPKISVHIVNQNQGDYGTESNVIARRPISTVAIRPSTVEISENSNTTKEITKVECDNDTTSASGPNSPATPMSMSNSPKECYTDQDHNIGDEEDRSEITITPATKEVETMTENICQICLDYPNANNEKVLWFRCFNPLCNYMVHTVCVGFQLQSEQQLKCLPPYFCPNHRN